MKLIAGVFILFAPIARASLLAFITVKQPLYLAWSGGGDEILLRDVQVVSDRAGIETDFGAIVIPFTPSSDGSWRQPGNVNIASLAGIKIRAEDPGKGAVAVVVDARAAKVPPNVTFAHIKNQQSPFINRQSIPRGGSRAPYRISNSQHSISNFQRKNSNRAYLGQRWRRGSMGCDRA